MAYTLSGSDRKILWIAAAVFGMLIIAAFLVVSPEGNEESIATTYSADSSGAKAAFLLLQKTGYRVERWEKSLEDIDVASRKTLILAEPVRAANQREHERLRRFIENGGRVIAIGQSACRMLPGSSCVPDPLEGMVWRKFPALIPSIMARAAPQIVMAPKARWAWSQGLPLYGDSTHNVVVSYGYGKGTVIWWAAATPLTNAGLRESGNLEFFLACLGDKGKTGILWDEYLHGYSASKKSTLQSILIGFALLQMTLLGMAVLWTFSRRSGPVRYQDPGVRLSPLEFVETLGGLYEHAHASAVAVDICYQRFLYWLARQLGMPATASIEEFERAVRNRWNFEDEHFGPTLRECASARYSAEFPAKQALRLVRSINSYASRLKLYPVSAKEDK